MKYWKEHVGLRLGLIFAFFVAGMVLLIVGWKMTGEYVDLLMIGGVFRRQYFGFHGYFAENAIRQMYSKVAFIGADAVNLQGGIMSHNQNDVPLKQSMIENSQKTILLCDHTKFGSYAFMHVAPLEKFDIGAVRAWLKKAE